MLCTRQYIMNKGHKMDSNNNNKNMFVDKNINKNVDKEVTKNGTIESKPLSDTLGSAQDSTGIREVYPPVTYAYVDALNLYHRMQNYITREIDPWDVSLKYVDLRKLLSLYIPEGSCLEKIYFFTSSPTHLGSDKVAHHRLYCKVLQGYCKIKVVEGFFATKQSSMYCKNRKVEVKEPCVKTSNEEKQTDVSLALQVLRDVLVDKPNNIMLLTNDSDFVPVIHHVKSESYETRIKWIVPPQGSKKQLSGNILKALKKNKERLQRTIIKKKHLELCMLPDELEIEGKIIKSPYKTKRKQNNDS